MPYEDSGYMESLLKSEEIQESKCAHDQRNSQKILAKPMRVYSLSMLMLESCR